MKLHRLSFENFTSFKEKTELNNIKPISIIAGSNSSGKSNIIEMFAFLRKMMDHNWSKPFEDLTFDRNKQPIKIELEFELDESERQFMIDMIPTPPALQEIDLSKDDIFKFVKYTSAVSAPRCLEERLYLWAKEQYVHVIHHIWTETAGNKIERRFANVAGHFHNSGTIDNFLQLQPTEKSDQSGNALGFLEPSHDLARHKPEYAIVEKIKNVLKEIRIFGAHRKAKHDYTGTEKWTLDENGENLIEVMSTILGEDPQDFSQIMKEYGEIVGTEFSITVPPIQNGNYHTIKLGEDGLTTKTDFLNISSGLHEVLILILAINKAKPNEIICIEEPEIHLHSSSQKRLIKYIQNHVKQNQFFITTHSPIFTGVEKNLTSYLVTKSKGKSSILPIEQDEQLKFIKQQLGIRNSDIFGNDYVIFVEGYSEEIAFPLISKALGNTDVGISPTSRIKMINLKGNGIIPILENFLDYLNNSDVEAFLIADGDKKVGNAVPDYLREGRLKEGHAIVWDKEFEDTFESEYVIQAMQSLATRKNFTFSLSAENLEEERNSGKKVADIIQKHLHENEQPDLVKPDLATELAEKIIAELKTKSSDDAPLFFKSIQKILNTINNIDKINSENELYDIEIPSEASLRIDNPYVTPREYVTTVGELVVWKNNDEEIHSVTSGRRQKISDDNDVGDGTPDGLFDKTLSPHENFKFTFEEKGIHYYYCKFHKCSEAKITVE